MPNKPVAGAIDGALLTPETTSTPSKGKRMIDAELHDKLRNFAIKTASTMMESITIVAQRSMESSTSDDEAVLLEANQAIYYQLGRVMAYAEIAKELLGLETAIPPIPPQIESMIAKFK